MDVSHAVNMDDALTKTGREHSMVLFSNTGHSLKGTPAIDMMINWFAAHMGKKEEAI